MPTRNVNVPLQREWNFAQMNAVIPTRRGPHARVIIRAVGLPTNSPFLIAWSMPICMCSDSNDGQSPLGGGFSLHAAARAVAMTHYYRAIIGHFRPAELSPIRPSPWNTLPSTVEAMGTLHICDSEKSSTF